MENERNTQKQQKISIEKYAGTVHQMRKAQRQYFRTRQNKYLVRSKELEQEVDRMTAELLTTQMDLFHG